MTKPVNHDEALEYARFHIDDSNLARCYLDLRNGVTLSPDEATEVLKAYGVVELKAPPCFSWNDQQSAIIARLKAAAARH